MHWSRNVIWPGVKAVVVTVLVASVAFAANKQRVRGPSYGFGLVFRRTYNSPSGVYSLEVDPAGRLPLGRYGAMYKFTINGEKAWAEERSYTLVEVVVTDEGMVVGFAYRDEKQATGGRLARRYYFHVVIIDRAGKDVLNDVRERQQGPLHTNPPSPMRPYAEQLIVDLGNDRVVLRVTEQRGPVWWRYHLASGQSVGRFDPTDLVSDSHRFGRVWRIEVVRDTPLTLVHCLMFATGRGTGNDGARFLLIDLHGNVLWRLELADDYIGMRDWETMRGLVPYLEDHPAILRTDRANRFDLRFFAENKRVTFSVDRDKNDKWVVSEVGRVDYEEPAP